MSSNSTHIECDSFATEADARRYVAQFKGAKKVVIEKRGNGWYVSFYWGCR
jgi:hypothetical protein